MKLTEAVARRIKELLTERNMTAYQLFKASGVPQSTISTILSVQTTTVKLSTLYDICAGLGIEIKDFFDAPYLSLSDIED